jgi:hypothetical protein
MTVKKSSVRPVTKGPEPTSDPMRAERIKNAMQKRDQKTVVVRRPEPNEDSRADNAREYESRGRGFARCMFRPAVISAQTIHEVMKEQYGSGPDFTHSGLSEELSAQCAEVSRGNLERPEAVLMTQSETLNTLFNHLTQLAHKNMNRFEVSERLFRLAFKAQSQSRATIETLALVKNPPSATFVKQANLANGPQQVNNNSRTREIEIMRNELLEQATDGKRLESRTSSGAGRRDSEMAPVGKINGTTNC